MKNQDIKKLINQAYEAAEVMNATPYGQYFIQKGMSSFQTHLEVELIKFVTYLANVKGCATEREVVLYKDCYRDSFSNIGIYQAQKLMDDNFEGDNYDTIVPYLLKAYLLIDIEMCKNGLDLKGTASMLYIDLLKTIGQFFVEYHGRVDVNEVSAMCEYIKLLDNARYDKLKDILNEEFLITERAEDYTEEEKYNSISTHETNVDTKNETQTPSFAIGNKGEGKKDKLLRSFDVLKNDFKKNEISIAETVARMFEIDRETAVDMWLFLLSIYEKEAQSEDAWYLTGGIISKGSMVIGDEDMDSIVLNNPSLKQKLFFRSGSWLHISVREIIRRRIENEELSLADELLQMVYDNPNKRDTWYEIMSNIMPRFKEISSDAYELLELWCDKVEDTEERAKLTLQLTEYI